MLIVGDVVATACVGDSRIIMSSLGGQKTYPLTKDHIPGRELEAQRIVAAGGRVYTQKKAILHYD